MITRKYEAVDGTSPASKIAARWHTGVVTWLGEFVRDYWWLVFVFGGSIGGAVKGLAAANQRRANRRLERYRIKQQAKVEAAKAAGMGRVNRDADRRDLAKALDEHAQTDARWFAYETDLTTLLDYPMMIDMRETLTVEFHKARRHAELLKPEDFESALNAHDKLVEYRDSVHDYAVAFDLAEQEAKRRRRGGFDPMEQQRLAKAQRLLAVAMDEAATAPERRQAYSLARKELDGLIVLPTRATTAIESSVRAALEPGA
jgi:hypothetical protein